MNGHFAPTRAQPAHDPQGLEQISRWQDENFRASNHRKFKNLYKPTGTKKYRRCTLAADEFIRRFLQLVLPRGFVSSAVRLNLLLLRTQPEEIYSHRLDQAQQADEDNPDMSEKNHTGCLSCECRMQLQGTIPRNGCGPL